MTVQADSNRLLPAKQPAGSSRPIAIVSEWLVRTHGQGRINLEVLRALRDAGHCMTAIATHFEPEPGVEWRPIHVPRLPTNWARGTLFRYRGGRAVRGWEREAGDAGLLISNGAAVPQSGQINLAMYVHTAWLRSPWHPRRVSPGPYAQYQALYNWANSRTERRAFHGARRVVALSEIVKQELVDHIGVPPERIAVIPPGVDPREFRPLASEEPNVLRAECGLSPAGGAELLLLFAGEIRTGRKNLDLVLRAVAAVRNVHLAVAGSTLGSPYPAMAAELGVADRVHWLGHCEDLPALYRGADAFVFPSHYEPFGLVVTEAMASGLPVVVTRQCGAAAMVTGDAGVVLEDGLALEALVETLRSWDASPDERLAIGHAARRTAEQYAWADMAAKMVSLVDDTCKSMA